MCSPWTEERFARAFRDRVDPPTGPTRGWVYLSDPVEIRESVAFMLEEWRLQGHAFFERFRPGSEALLRLLTDPRPRKLLADDRSYIRIALHLGERARAKALIETALASASEKATILRADLLALLQ